MERPGRGEILHLMAARDAAGDEHGVGRQAAGGREQPPLADLPRHLEMLPCVAERSGHPAAAGVEIDRRAPGDPRQERIVPARAGPSPSGGSVRATGSAPDRGRRGRARPPAARRRRGTPRRAARAPRPRAPGAGRRRRGAPARPRARPRGSWARRRSAAGAVTSWPASRSAFAAARSRASWSSPCEINGRPQHKFGASDTRNPAASRTSAPAMPMCGSK